MDRRKLAEEVRKTRPLLPIVFMTGYTPKAVTRGDKLGSGWHLLTKPFILEQLATKLQNARADDAARTGAASRASSLL